MLKLILKTFLYLYLGRNKAGLWREIFRSLAISVGGPELCTFQLTIAVLVLSATEGKNRIISGIQPSLGALASSDSECKIN